jgi:acyl-[acyl-carrier-protein]-phospholipid O-acyltransferase/long-chain-fatty-acid--[acyl-carrier-protein] ligase
MRLFSRSKFIALNRFFSRLPGFSKPDKNSLRFLNLAQFFGVLNDNIFKFVIIYLLIDILGQKNASSILYKVGALFVIPFLLFSSAAGVLADRFSKQRLLIAMKVAEMCIMTLAIFAFALKSIWASYTLLFLLSTHSALFGPSKYAIIPELVPPDRVSRANGLITSCTYLGIIIGTFFASFMTSITGKNFVLVAGFCLLIAAAGFVSTFGIRRTPPQGSQKKINPLFLKEIWETLNFAAPRRHLLIAMTGSAYFLFIGAFTQLNIIPFAIDSLHLSEISGGYLFLSTALGIALGSYLGGKASRSRVELGLPCLAGFMISGLLALLSIFSTSLTGVITLLIFLGIFGGFFVVPFDTFVQLYSPDEKRGQVIATNNFLSFFGVLVASFALFFYSQMLEISSAAGFGVTGLITFFFSIFLFVRLSDFSFPFFTRLFLRPFFRLQILHPELLEKSSEGILVLRNATRLKALLLCSAAPKVHFLVSHQPSRFYHLFYSIHSVPSDATGTSLLEKAKELASDTVTPCLLIRTPSLPEALQPTSKVFSFFKLGAEQIVYVDIDFKPHTTIHFKKK